MAVPSDHAANEHDLEPGQIIRAKRGRSSTFQLDQTSRAENLLVSRLGENEPDDRSEPI